MNKTKPATYVNFDGEQPPAFEEKDSSLDLIIDVPMQVTIELGKCRKYVKEILDFNIGTIIVLDKLAGEPVDVVINGKPVARGEVVVIDDNYGVRITEIITAASQKV